jgi:signal transduction histidine kinase
MKKMILFILESIYLVIAAFTAEGQEIGKPLMTTFSSKEIRGHVQNWAIIQDHRGVIYIGDGLGTQVSEGSTWRLIESPNQSFSRSFAIDANGRIYVGSSGMLGYLEPDKAGSMRYVSLMDYIRPEDQIFNYVWSVQATPEGVYFQTRERLFRFHPSADGDREKTSENWEIKVWKPKENFSYTFCIDKILYIHQQGMGLTKMVGDSLVPVPGGEQFAGDRVQVLLPFLGKPGVYLIGTFNRGLFTWDGKQIQPFRTSSDSFLREGTVYTGVVLPDSCFALGTMARGMLVIDQKGKTKLHLTLDDGLLSNTVSVLYVDQQKNLWVGMDGGIGIMEYNSPLLKFDLPAGSSPTDFSRYKNILYTSANTGVAYLDPVDSRFKFLSGMTGNNQAFYFSQFGGNLFIVTGEGIYRIEGKKAIPVFEANSLDFVFLYLLPSRQDPKIVLGSLTSGLALLHYNPGDPDHIKMTGRIPGIHEYIRYLIEPEPGIFWLSPMDVGPIRLTFSGPGFDNPKVEKFDNKNGLPNGGVTVYNSVRGIIFLTKRGVYNFDSDKKTFSPDPFFKNVTLGRNPDEGIVVSDQKGNIWANLGSETVLFEKLPGGEYRLNKEILSRFADDPAVSIYPEKDGYTWFGTTNYAIRLTPGKALSALNSFQALVRRVSTVNDSIIYNGNQSVSKNPSDSAGPVISYRFNAMRFDYAAPFYSNPRANEYRSRLEGFDKGWSAWKRETSREYTNLPAGKYRFYVQSKNIFNQVSQEDVYAFYILHPWYSNWWAYISYVLIAAALLLGLVTLRTRKLRKRSRLLEKTIEERTAEIKAQKENIEQLSIIGRDITDNLSIGEIINTVYENVNTLMDAAVFSIGLFQDEKQALVFPATKEKGVTLDEFSIPLSDEDRLAVWCFKNQQDVIINDYNVDYVRYTKKLQSAMAGEVPESILYLPLLHKSKMIGVITAQSFNKNAYTAYHINMLRNLATYCAIALENADAYRQLNNLLEELKSTQDKLVTQSKLAALGTLTAGIAHEIKNPLNFINNFSGLNAELAEELHEEVQKEKENLRAETLAEVEEIVSNLRQNAIRIQEHGRRADSIVRSMLQHSRGGSGDRQPTDINFLLEEALNLTYHGMRAQDIGFNIKIEKSFDATIGKIDVIPQEISRAFLNILSNGCYEAYRKRTESTGEFSPLLSVKTLKTGNKVKIIIRDNGNGIPVPVREKLFTPFFTTKPAGQGTGLGLSITWDIIVQQHRGQISFATQECEESFTEFTIILPIN